MKSLVSIGRTDRPEDPDFMQSLARGLTVLRAVVQARAPVSISELARTTGLPRAAVRRCVHTLALLDYVARNDTRTVVGLGFAALAATYSGSSALILAAQPVLDRLRDDLGLTVSLGILSGGAAVYLARATDGRRWHSDVPLGGDVPAYCTALGRVLLAHRTNEEITDYLENRAFHAWTARTVTVAEQLRLLLDDVRQRGFAIVDQELEIGLRAIAAPVRGTKGEVIAAINVATQPALVSSRQLRTRILPALLDAARELTRRLFQ